MKGLFHTNKKKKDGKGEPASPDVKHEEKPDEYEIERQFETLLVCYFILFLFILTFCIQSIFIWRFISYTLHMYHLFCN